MWDRHRDVRQRHMVITRGLAAFAAGVVLSAVCAVNAGAQSVVWIDNANGGEYSDPVLAGGKSLSWTGYKWPAATNGDPSFVSCSLGNAFTQDGKSYVAVPCVAPGGTSYTGYAYQKANGAPTNACTPGAFKATTINFTIGYKRTPDDSDSKWIGAPVYPSSGGTCNNGCTFDMGNTPSGAYISQAPGPNGLYRVSGDFTAMGTGHECTAEGTTPQVKPAEPAPDCPGYVGEVNGKPGCYGTASKPVITTDAPLPPNPVAGNPSAGAKPVTGEGSGEGGAGRTPAAGTGVNNGGPAAAAAGGKGGGAGGTASGSGSTSASVPGEQQAACGAPGQPVCAVKVDETGTPTSASFADADQKIQDYKGQATDARTAAAGTADKGMFEPFKDLWSAPPMQTCEAFVLPASIGKTIDPCPVADGMRQIMAFIWAAVALFCCFRWIKEAL